MVLRMNKCTLIVFDLDGTLLTDHKTISKESVFCINELRKRNVKISIASGRKFEDLSQYVRQLNIKDDEYIICSDGQCICNRMGMKLWQGKSLQISDIKYIQEKCHSSLNVIGDQDYFLPQNSMELILSWIFKEFIFKYKNIYTISHIEKLNKQIQFQKVRVRKFKKNIDYSTINSKYCVHNVFGKCLDITAKGINKFEALKILLGLYGMKTLDEVLFFGNDTNDVECFRNLKNTVATGNAVSSIKKYANDITASNNENGVAKYLINYFNIEIGNYV